MYLKRKFKIVLLVFIHSHKSLNIILEKIINVYLINSCVQAHTLNHQYDSSTK